MEDELNRGKAQINSCSQIYKMQLASKRHFIHEHPDGSTAWNAPEVVEFMMRPEVDAAVLLMCAYGMTSTEDIGDGLVKKPSRMISLSPVVRRRIEARCSNEIGGHQHRHVRLVQGRAKAAQVYPRELGMKICE